MSKKQAKKRMAFIQTRVTDIPCGHHVMNDKARAYAKVETSSPNTNLGFTNKISQDNANRMHRKVIRTNTEKTELHQWVKPRNGIKVKNKGTRKRFSKS